MSSEDQDLDDLMLRLAQQDDDDEEPEEPIDDAYPPGDHLVGDTLLRPQEVMKALGIGKSSFYELLKKDSTFPRPVQILPGGRAVGFIEREVDDWIATRPRVGAT